jgi:reverse gyrase
MLVSALLERVWPELGTPLEDIRKVWLRFSQGFRDALKRKEIDALEDGFFKRTLVEVRDYIVENLEKPEKVKAIEAFPRWVFNRETKEVIFADTNLYIQASGRASRLLAEGLLKGMSVVLCEDERIVRSLQEGLLRRLGEVKIRQATVEEIGEAWKVVLKEREERKGIWRIWDCGFGI